MRFGHAHGQLVEAEAIVESDLLLGFRRILHTCAAVNFADNGFDLLLDTHLQRIQEFEFPRLLACGNNCLPKLDGAKAALRPVIGHYGIVRPRLHGEFANKVNLRRGVRLEAIHRDHNGDAEEARILNHFGEIRAALLEQRQILLGVIVMQRLSRGDFGAASMHFQCADRSDQNHAVRSEAAVPAFDIAEFFHADVRAETCFREHIAVRSHKLERNLIRDDRRVAVRDIRERPGVHKGRRALKRLHQIGQDRVLHQHGQRAARAEIVRGDRLTSPAGTDHHGSQTFAHVREAGREGEDRHDLAGHGDVVARHARHALLFRPLPDGDLAQHAVVCVCHAAPRDAVRVNVQT